MSLLEKHIYRFSLLILFIYISLEYISRLTFSGQEEDSVILPILKISLLLLWFSYIMLNNIRQKDQFINIVIIWSIYLFLTSIIHVSDFRILATLPYKVLFWPISLVFFYLTFKKHHVILLKTTVFFFCFLITIYTFYFIKEYTFVNIGRINSRTTLNISYFFLLLIPWIFLIEKRLIRLILIILIMSAILLSVKRTAIISLFLATITGYLTEIFIQDRKTSKKYLFRLLFLVIFAVLLIFIINNFSSGWIFARFESIPQDRGTSRLDIYSKIFQLLSDSSFFQLLIGHGHNSVKDYMFGGLSAHNDWLECIFDYGIIGFIIYLFLNILIIKKIKSLYKNQSVYTPAMSSSYIIFTIMSITSHLIIYPYVFILMTSLWGIIFGITSNHQNANKTIVNEK